MTTTATIPEINSAIALSRSPAPNEVFALTDEQILEFAPESPDPAAVAPPILPARPGGAVRDAAQTDSKTAQTGLSALLEPPPWLAAQMKDLWNGDEARELWDGVQQARQEAAAYRQGFAKPEDARPAIQET